MSLKINLIASAILTGCIFSSSTFALDYKVNVNALHYATSINKVAYVEELIKDEPNLVVQFNKEGMTPLHISIDNDSISSLSVLLKNKVNPNIKNAYGETALVYAIKKGKLKAAKLLLEFNANPEIKDNNGFDAKYYADKNPKMRAVFEIEAVPVTSPIIIQSNEQELNDFKSEIEKTIQEKTNEIIQIIEIEKTKRLELESSLNTKISSLSEKVDQLLESNQNLSKSLELNDINVLSIEEKSVENKELLSNFKKEVLYVTKQLDKITSEINQLKENDYMNMYQLQSTTEEQNIELIRFGENIQEVEQGEEELKLIDFGNSQEVELDTFEDNSLDYK